MRLFLHRPVAVSVVKPHGVSSMRVLCLVALLLVSTACGSFPASDALPDRYQCERSFGSEILVLRPNGSFVQVIDIEDRPEPLVNKGTWEYDRGRGSLDLTGAIVVDDGHGGIPTDLSPQTGTWALEARSRLGRITLSWNPDFDFTFKRI